MELKLTKPKGRNKWCGPAALSATLGITTHYAAKVVREVTGRDRVIGMFNSEMEKALKKFGVKYRVEKPNITLNQFRKSFSDLAIVEMRGHYIAMDSQYFTDNGNLAPGRKLTSLSAFPSPKAKVKTVFYIQEHNVVEPVPERSAPVEITCFADLISLYGKGNLQDEIEHFEQFVPERIDGHFGEGTYNSLKTEHDVRKKYVEMCFGLTEINCPIRIKDYYLWDIVQDDVSASPCLENQGRNSLRTVLMLNGKHRFITEHDLDPGR